jgi:aspartate ammonia-lyase
VQLGALDGDVASAMITAADEVLKGHMDNQFPVDIFQGGGGTSINMNLNEVIANRANEILTGKKGYDRVHPNNHVNMGQSTNDVIPCAVKLSMHFFLEELVAGLGVLEKVLERKTFEFKDVVKIGRTCLQDAVPMTLGQEFSGYLSFVRRHIRIAEQMIPECQSIPLGATAIGTELGTRPGYVEQVYSHLSDIVGFEVRREENFFDGLQNDDLYLRISAVLKSIAIGLSKIASDLRILSSGPRAGFGEIELPALQPGSSIMPGKINPVLPEMVIQVCFQVCGNDLAVSMAVERGELELGVWHPLLAKCMFESFGLLIRSLPLFADSCIDGIKANEEVCRRQAESSLSLAAVVSSQFGYKEGNRVAKYAFDQGLSIAEAVVEMKLMESDEAEKLLNPIVLADPEACRKILFPSK